MNSKNRRFFNYTNGDKSARLAQMGLLTAISCMFVYFIHIPIFPAISFIKYDPADIPILIGTLLFGPASGILITAAVSIIQGLLVEGGVFDAIMHVLATGTLVILSGTIYKQSKTSRSAIAGLLAGTFGMAAIMIAANLIITPLYLGISRSLIFPLLPYIILFNLLKAGVNSMAAFLLYKKIGLLFI